MIVYYYNVPEKLFVQFGKCMYYLYLINKNISICYSEFLNFYIYSYINVKKKKLNYVFYILINNILYINYNVFHFKTLYNTNYLKSTLFCNIIRYRIIGRGYKVYSNFCLLLFKLGYAHVIYYMLPIQFYTLKKKKTDYFYRIIGMNLNHLKNILNIISNFKIPNIYTKKGILKNGIKLNFKLGKKSFRI